MQAAIQPNSRCGGVRQTTAPNLALKDAANAAPALSPKILLTDAEAAVLFGVSLRRFLDLQHEPWFPKPVRLGPRLKRHLRAELEAAVVNMPRQDRPAEPVQLLRGKVEKKERARGAA
jgi:predicted DNA-binding transcriptional regulator AlpA